MYETIMEACRAWVKEMHHIPMSVIDKLAQANPGDLQEITPPTKYDRVYINYGDFAGQTGEIVEVNKNGTYLVKLDANKEIVVGKDDLEIATIHEDYFPMWGTMWAFSDTIDNDWLEGVFGENGLQLMADCGFRIYESEDYDYVFGIDGAGYEFYPAHWIPLYKARGLKWHKEEEENGDNGRNS